MIVIAKIENDKYYTSKELAKYVVNKTKEIIGKNNITEYLEPSAGNGVFLDLLDKPYLAYDIEPEDKLNRIVKQDYLTLDLQYKKDRCIIGNPPFGNKHILVTMFYKKSIQLGDYIAFILPVGQYKNNIEMFEFDLIHSEDLGKQTYSGRKIHCCFNIYKRNPNGTLNKKPNYKLKDVKITTIQRYLNKDETDLEYDTRICAWGASIGKEVENPNQYAKEYCIKIYNDTYKDKILKLIKQVNGLKNIQ